MPYALSSLRAFWRTGKARPPLEEDDFEEALGPYLDGDEMEALLERRKRLLEHVDRLLQEHPKPEVFFSRSEGEQP